MHLGFPRTLNGHMRERFVNHGSEDASLKSEFEGGGVGNLGYTVISSRFCTNPMHRWSWRQVRDSDPHPKLNPHAWLAPAPYIELSKGKRVSTSMHECQFADQVSH